MQAVCAYALLNHLAREDAHKIALVGLILVVHSLTCAAPWSSKNQVIAVDSYHCPSHCPDHCLSHQTACALQENKQSLLQALRPKGKCISIHFLTQRTLKGEYPMEFRQISGARRLTSLHTIEALSLASTISTLSPTKSVMETSGIEPSPVCTWSGQAADGSFMQYVMSKVSPMGHRFKFCNLLSRVVPGFNKST